MPLRRKWHIICPECGKRQITVRNGKAYWRPCDCPGPPGPPDYPRKIEMTDIIFPDAGGEAMACSG